MYLILAIFCVSCFCIILKINRCPKRVLIKDIEPFCSYFPSVEELTKKQFQSYALIKTFLNRSIFVDVGDNISYVFLYIYEILENIKNIHDVHVGIDKLNRIKVLYQHNEKIKQSTTIWIADLFYMVDDYENALLLYKSLLNLKNINTHLANNILNIKYKLNKKTEAIEWLSLNKKFTNFISDKYEDVQKYCDFVLLEERKLLKKDYVKYIAEKYKNVQKYPHYLFSGLPCGYNLQGLKKKIDYYMPFYSIPEVLEFCEKLSRDAENLLREKMELPKVGENWISETELFYKIKNKYPQYTIIPHYREKWLGRQHLDIYIDELKVAFEYQGMQHFKPIDFFGGEKAFLENQRRDQIKKEKCENAKVALYLVEPNYNFNDIILIIEKHIASGKRKH